MSIDLPDIIETYFRAANAHDTAAMSACFTEDAVVHDEGREYRGITAIRDWIDTTTQKYRVTINVTDIKEQSSNVIVSSQVSGNFDGSPVELQFHFTLEGDKIAALTIRA